MGFDPIEARVELQNAQGDVDQATTALLSKVVDERG